MRFDGGRVCLDLAATKEHGQAETADELRDTAQLSRWLYGAGLVPAATAIPVESGWLPHFHELRALLRRLVACEVDGDAPTPDDIAALNQFARPAPPAPAAVPEPRTEPRTATNTATNAATNAATRKPPQQETEPAVALSRRLAAPPTWESLASVVARDAVDLLTDPAARDRLRRCEGERCHRVYLDTSRGRRRRWCSSEVCGNRERVARHRRRTTLAGTQG
ncbi:CGNR zinc finger domain-containing protein [Streptomyces sp. NPDC088194]|uniref:CGNR zinc finger domain-containing protein n=1 Tax=Streptomyces sp. NPDC088194 TaxID=3154931 RepID=UPI00344B2A3F